MSPIETATAFSNMGIAAIPIEYRSKRPEVKWDEFKTRLPHDTEQRQWFAGNLHNVGVVCGWRGLTVIDFDTVQDYGKWQIWSEQRGGVARHVARSAYRVNSARGVHVYIRLPRGERTRKMQDVSVLGSGDVKGVGGYVLAEGSVHPSGVEYKATRSGFSFPLVGALSDILPAPLLANTEPLAHINPMPKITVNDVWSSASAPRTPGRDKVQMLLGIMRLEQFFVEAKPSSADRRFLMALCPFHDDHDPSFHIDTKKQIGNCYSCRFDKPLDAINFYARLHSLNNGDAVRMLALQYGI